MNYGAFISYILLTAFTPGPNNIMAMTNAGKFGFKKGFRFCIGVLLGTLIVMICSATFGTLLFQLIPGIKPVMSFIGAAYILWLAWSVFRDRSHENRKTSIHINSVFSGMILQFINVKVILYGITAMSTFVLPYYSNLTMAAVFVVLLTGLCFFATCCWALCGSVFERLFREHKRVLNIVMALMLVYCSVSQIITG